MKVYCVFQLESPHQGNSNEYTIKIYHFQYEKRKSPLIIQICSYGIFFQGTQERVQNSHGKWAICIRATEVLLYKVWIAYVQTKRTFPSMH